MVGGLRAVAAAAVLAGVGMQGGCTLVQMQREEREDAARVQQKETALQAEQAQADELDRQKQQLTAELAERQLSLTELNQRVDELRTANARDSSDNEMLRIERRKLLGELRDTNAELAALQHSADGSAQKRERVEFLKHQLDTQLDLLLH